MIFLEILDINDLGAGFKSLRDLRLILWTKQFWHWEDRPNKFECMRSYNFLRICLCNH